MKAKKKNIDEKAAKLAEFMAKGNAARVEWRTKTANMTVSEKEEFKSENPELYKTAVEYKELLKKNTAAAVNAINKDEQKNGSTQAIFGIVSPILLVGSGIIYLIYREKQNRI